MKHDRETFNRLRSAMEYLVKIRPNKYRVELHRTDPDGNEKAFCLVEYARIKECHYPLGQRITSRQKEWQWTVVEAIEIA